MGYGRVVLADRHLAVLGGVHSVLDTRFASVVMVSDEHSLLEAVATFKPDLAVVDLSLAQEGETNVVLELLRRHPDLRLIVLSVHDEATIVDRLLAAGADGFVFKRSMATDLAPAIEEVMRGGTYVSGRLQGRRADQTIQR